jgi:hypothetical protein
MVSSHLLPSSSNLFLACSFSNHNCPHFSPLSCMLYASHLILLDSITLKYLVNSTNYETSHFAAASNFLLLPPSLVQIFSLTLCSQGSSVSTVIRLRVGGAKVLFLAGAKIFFSSPRSPDWLWTYTASYPMGTGSSFLVVMRPRI